MKSLAIKWPTKVKKFGITDPILKFIIAKYEKEIPWQSKVKNEETLINFIKNEMLKDLYSKISLSTFKKTGKGLFARPQDVDINLFLENEHYDSKWKKEIKDTIEKEGERKAEKILAEKINKYKERRFREWKKIVKELFPNEPQFEIAFLRPLFELSGKGTRRPLPKPNEHILLWLNKRLKKEKIETNLNLAKLYFYKLAYFDSDFKLKDGWHFVSSMKGGSQKLSALSKGSGWCIANQDIALNYLRNYDFYILILNKKPKVALRMKNFYIVECEGPNNTFPSPWLDDIAIFSTIMDFKDNAYNAFGDLRVYCLDAAFEKLESMDTQNFEWWEERKRIFPFSVFLAPSKYKKRLLQNIKKEYLNYSNFLSWKQLLSLMEEDLEDIFKKRENAIIENPLLFNKLPWKEKEKLKDVCIKGWIDKAEEFDITLSQIDKIPDFVWENKKFRKTISENFPLEIKYAIRKYRSTYNDRQKPFNIDKFLPPSLDDPAELALERMIDILLRNQDGIYIDEIFPPVLRNRKDFNQLRRKAWFEAMEIEPPLYFALPDDLRQTKEFAELFSSKTKDEKLLKKWESKVLEKPWIVRQKNKIPKSIRLHKRILNAYRDGWVKLLKKTPFKLWISPTLYTSVQTIWYQDYFFKLHKRIYLSYALLNDEIFIDNLKESWIKHEFECWEQASERTKNIPAIQYSIAKAMAQQLRERTKNVDTIAGILYDIENRIAQYTKNNGLKPPFYEDLCFLISKAKKMMSLFWIQYL